MSLGILLFSSRLRGFAWAVSVCLLLFFACSRQPERYIEISAGRASQTLKEFAKQADIEIVFNAPSVDDVRTNAVAGNMTPAEALNAMLAGTALTFERDAETGAYAVTTNGISDTTAQGTSSASEMTYSANN